MTEAVSFSQAATDLPLEVTTFVGRRSDRTRIRELMAESRLVTLTGFGGIGKTRLALRMATELRRLFEGVHVVALAGLTDPEDVPDEFAATLGLQGRSRQSATIATVEYLRSRSVLLVLDNCEHVIDVAAVMADTLLRTCPGVRILATSREPLRIQGEVEFPVAPLVVPSVTTGAEPLQQYEAVQLFLDRARAIDPDFSLTEDNRAAVAAISRKLEGIPLAIELAAARLRAFTPSRAGRAADRPVGAAGQGQPSRPVPAPDHGGVHRVELRPVHGGGEAAVGEGVRLRRRVRARRGGSGVLRTPTIRADRGHPGLAGGEVGGDREPRAAGNRYRMLPPIRNRGRAELVRIGRNTEVGRRHTDFYLGLLSQAHEDWFGPRQLDWIGRLRRDLGNIAKALAVSATHPDGPDRGLRAGAEPAGVRTRAEPLPAGPALARRVLGQWIRGSEIRARALRTACLWAVMQGDVEAATRLLEEGRALVTGLDRDAETLFVQAAGFVALFTGDPARAAQLLDEAAAPSPPRATSANSPSAPPSSPWTMSSWATWTAHWNTTLRALRSPNRRARPGSGPGRCGVRDSHCGPEPTAAAAHELVTESLRLKRLLGEPVGIAVLLDTLAWFTADRDPERASVLLGAAQNEWDRIDTSQVLAGLGTPRSAATQIARTLLGEAGFDLAFAHGRSLNQATAIAVALDEEPTPTRPATTNRTNRHPGLGTDTSGASDCRARPQGTQQQGDRRHPGHLTQDRRDTRGARPGQAGLHESHAGRCVDR